MRKVLVLFFVLSFFQYACGAANIKETADSELAADFSLNDLKGNTVTLSDFKDKKPVILFFWATWCPFCLQELKTLNTKYQQIQKDGVELLAIDVGEPSYRVESFVDSRNLSLRVLLDRNTSVAETYGLLGLPTYIFIGKDGRVSFEEHNFRESQYRRFLSE